MTPLSIATDEDVANRCIGDWPLIVPKFQRVAKGIDGVFSSGDLWTLTSATNGFAAQGVKLGHLLLIYKDATQGSGEIDDILAVQSVSGSSATLRRVGMGASLGSPYPGPSGATAVSFRILTADPQIARATYEIQRLYNLQSVNDLADAEDIRAVVVLMVLENLYGNAARNFGELADDFASKMKVIRSELRAAREQLDSRYGLMNFDGTASAGVMPCSADVPLLPYPYGSPSPYSQIYPF